MAVESSGNELAAKRYSVAVFQLAITNNDAEAWESALDQIAAFMGDPEVRRVLENTRVSQEAKQQLIEAALGDLPPLPLNLARLLVKKGRTNLAPEIAEQFKAQLEQQQGISRAHATTAIALTEEERASLVRRLGEQTGRQIILDTEVDPKVLGGLVIQIGDRLVDASTRHKLEELRESLVNA